MKITLKDGSVKEYDQVKSVFDILEHKENSNYGW